MKRKPLLIGVVVLALLAAGAFSTMGVVAGSSGENRFSKVVRRRLGRAG